MARNSILSGDNMIKQYVTQPLTVISYRLCFSMQGTSDSYSEILYCAMYKFQGTNILFSYNNYVGNKILCQLTLRFSCLLYDNAYPMPLR